MTPYLKYLKSIVIKTCNIWIPETEKQKKFFKRNFHKYLSDGNETTTSIISVIFKYKANIYLDILKRCAVLNINYLH